MTSQEEIERVIEKFWETIPPAWHTTRGVIRLTAADKFHLTVEQFQVLRRIRKGVNSVSALADANNTSRSAVSKAVDALVNKGLILRCHDPNDRRNIPLSLTQEGERILKAIFEGTEKWLAEKFRRLTSAELNQVLEAMQLFQKVFE